MAKKDTDMMENPPIWRIDGKSLLQKFQAFEKDGKMLYRNISTVSTGVFIYTTTQLWGQQRQGTGLIHSQEEENFRTASQGIVSYRSRLLRHSRRLCGYYAPHRAKYQDLITTKLPPFEYIKTFDPF